MPILRGFWDEVTARFPRVYGPQLQEIESKADQELESLIEALSDSQLDALLTTIRDRRTRIDTGAAYGNEIVSISKQILAFGGAGVGLVAAFAHNLADLPALILKIIGVAALFYFDLVVLSLYTIMHFVWLTRFRYPFLYFKHIGNTVPFFYYQAISSEVPRTSCQTADEKLIAAKLYASDLTRFARHLIPDISGQEAQATDAKSSAVQDSERRLKRRVVRDELQQYFLLISYQGYVNQFEVRANNQFFYGLVASIISSVVIAVFAFARG